MTDLTRIAHGTAPHTPNENAPTQQAEPAAGRRAPGTATPP